MNENIKIANQMIKIAKSLLAFSPKKEVIDNDVTIYTDMRKYGNMKFDGLFIIITAPYQKTMLFKDDIKKLGFYFDSSTKQWYVFNKKLQQNGSNFESLINLIKNKLGVNNVSNPVSIPSNNPVSQPVNNNANVKLSFGYVKFEAYGIVFIVDPIYLCEDIVKEFISNLKEFTDDCNNIVKVLKQKFGNRAKFNDIHFNGMDDYDMHGDGEIYNNLSFTNYDPNFFNDIEKFFIDNHINYQRK